MKKLALIMSLMLCLLCFVGCNNNEVVVNGDENNNQQEEQNPNVENPNIDEENNEESKEEEPKVEEPKVEEPKEEEPKVEEPKVEEPKEEEPKVEEPKVEEPKEDEKPAEGKVIDLYEAMTNIVTKAEAEVRMPMQEAIPVEVSFSFMGITEEDFTTYVAESIVYESMVSPANQSICLIKVNDSSKVADLKKSIIDNCNPRKWICMSAEKAVVVDSGDYILLAMAAVDKCDSIVSAFTEEFGSAGEVLSKGGDL